MGSKDRRSGHEIGSECLMKGEKGSIEREDVVVLSLEAIEEFIKDVRMFDE